ncbi:MAG: sugar transferase, partial [Paludibacteraceae bacterium]|nr:sugar transferase [Paludibacteraceae bacterium]
MKRLCDILLSLFGLIILCPLLLAVSIWILSDSHGGVFYRQIRVGRGNRDFSILKFRTMQTDSDKRGLLTVGGRDCRVTKAGYYLRKYKIDELPQLWNVLKG